MTYRYAFATLGVLIGIVFAFGLNLFTPHAEAGITYQGPTQLNSFINHTFFTGTTTSATSTNASASSTGDRTVRLDGATKATFYFSRATGGGNTGTSRFEVEVSPDGVTWYDFSRLYLMDAAKTATTSVSISAATTTVMASMDLEMSAFHFARCNVIEFTDGAHTCAVSVQY